MVMPPSTRIKGKVASSDKAVADSPNATGTRVPNKDHLVAVPSDFPPWYLNKTLGFSGSSTGAMAASPENRVSAPPYPNAAATRNMKTDFRNMGSLLEAHPGGRARTQRAIRPG